MLDHDLVGGVLAAYWLCTACLLVVYWLRILRTGSVLALYFLVYWLRTGSVLAACWLCTGCVSWLALYPGCVSCLLYPGSVSWLCILAVYWLCTGSVLALYWLRILAEYPAYPGCVSWLCTSCVLALYWLYTGCVPVWLCTACVLAAYWLCNLAVYPCCVSWLCILAVRPASGLALYCLCILALCWLCTGCVLALYPGCSASWLLYPGLYELAVSWLRTGCILLRCALRCAPLCWGADHATVWHRVVPCDAIWR